MMNLKTEGIQELLRQAQKRLRGINSEKWDGVIEDVWSQLVKGCAKIDDQLLCSTCFYTMLKLTNNQEYYLNEISNIIKGNLIHDKALPNSNTIVAVSLMYGLLQSAYMTKDIKVIPPIINQLLNSSLELLIKLAYEYSRFTFVVFKTLTALKKIIGTDFQDGLLTNENVRKILNLVNHNWENPITGVRDLNRMIFRILLSVMDEKIKERLIEQINNFYWNKAKYLMLTEIIEMSQNSIMDLVINNNWTYGLVYSLQKPGLVSAGADMYFAVIKKMKSDQQWSEMFLSSIIKIIKGTNRKEIENLNNYWYLTTFKTFPSLFLLLKENFECDTDYSDEILYSYLSLVRKANKLSLVKKKDLFLNKSVEIGLKHCDTDIRILAFDIICVSQGKTIATEAECQLITDYLENNINSDCTVLRINMIASFKNFFKHHTSLISSCNKESIQFQFVRNVLKFIDLSFALDGNYQRKIATLKICDVYLNNANNFPAGVKEALHKESESILNKLLELLDDPAEDIRENAKHILSNYYIQSIDSQVSIDTLIKTSLQTMESKFFYQICCSQTKFKLITFILCKRGFQHAKFNTVEELFCYVYEQFIQDFETKRDILNSIENGRQLHAFISILHVILETCYKERYCIDISSDTMSELIGALENISNQFSWEHKGVTSSDFSKMSEMVQDLIKSSSHVLEQNSESKISGLEQLVLNCLWLNVKASCDLASFLIKFRTEDRAVCERALYLIAHVLETSRHKGAIEAAGVSLGQAIQYLTSLQEGDHNSNLPFHLLKCKLQELISETNRMSSITRRGAGLSIMVHRIVSGDMRKGKPLFHYFMRFLLEICLKTEDMPEKASNPDIDNERDLPKAIYIHFLTRIVTDSSLAWDGMYYSTELAELAFDNLTSKHWQIRNAALQLYGALVPKLIGQKKASGVGDDTIATVACDEFITHSPKLWSFIKKQLEYKHSHDKIQWHSNLIPILNILGNIARRYNFTEDLSVFEEFDNDFLESLVELLGSPIYKVRVLAAQSIYNIFTSETVLNVILKDRTNTENHLHGILLLLKLFSTNNLNQEKLVKLKYILGEKLKSKKHSYLCQALFEHTFEIMLDLTILEDTFLEVDNNKHIPGVEIWGQRRIKKLLSSICFDRIPDILEKLLLRKDYEGNCKYLLPRLETVISETHEETLISIAKIIIAKQNFSSSIIWKMLDIVSQKVDLQPYIKPEELLNTFFSLEPSYKVRYMIPFIVRTSIYCMGSDEISSFTRIVNSLSDADVDVDMRLVAAEANNVIAKSFRKLSDQVKIVSIKTAITLLQDEDEDVRNESVKFYINVINNKTTYQPYISLKMLLSPSFINLTMNNVKSSVEQLSNELSGLIKSMNVNKVDEYNPFANDCKNIYFEGKVLKHFVDQLKILYDVKV